MVALLEVRRATEEIEIQNKRECDVNEGGKIISAYEDGAVRVVSQ